MPSKASGKDESRSENSDGGDVRETVMMTGGLSLLEQMCALPIYDCICSFPQELL